MKLFMLDIETGSFALQVGPYTFRVDGIGVSLIKDEGPGEKPVFAWVRA